MLGTARKPITSLQRLGKAEKEEAATVHWTAERAGQRRWFLRSDSEFAGPTTWDTWKPWKARGAVLREKGRKAPPGLVVTPRWRVEQPERFSGGMKECADIFAFWTSAHGWNELRPVGLSEAWVRGLFRCGECVGVGLRTPEGELVATAMSVPHEGEFVISGESVKKQVRDVIGLVVHDEMRGRGVAAWLFAWLDHLTSGGGAVIHVGEDWNSVRRRKPFSLTRPIATERMVSLVRARLPRHSEPEGVIRVSNAAAQAVVSMINAEKRAEWDVYSMCKTCCGVEWWRSVVDEYPSCSVLAGVRFLEAPYGWDNWKKGARPKAGGKPERIAIIVFGVIVRTRPGNAEDMYDPFWDDESSARVEACFINLCRRLDCDRMVLMECHSRGSTSCLSWKDPWVSEIGVTWSPYVYNMLVPSHGMSGICWV